MYTYYTYTIFLIALNTMGVMIRVIISSGIIYAPLYITEYIKDNPEPEKLLKTHVQNPLKTATWESPVESAKNHSAH